MLPDDGVAIALENCSCRQHHCYWRKVAEERLADLCETDKQRSALRHERDMLLDEAQDMKLERKLSKRCAEPRDEEPWATPKRGIPDRTPQPRRGHGVRIRAVLFGLLGERVSGRKQPS